jgi:hypothetical protein
MRMAAITLAGGSLVACGEGAPSEDASGELGTPERNEGAVAARRESHGPTHIEPLRQAAQPLPPSGYRVPPCNANPDPCCLAPDLPMCRKRHQDAGNEPPPEQDAGAEETVPHGACDAS